MIESTKNSIKNLLGVPEIKDYKKYFGLPTVVGKNRRASLNYIKERVWGETLGLEGEAIVLSWERSVIESSCSSHTYICYELL